MQKLYKYSYFYAFFFQSTLLLLNAFPFILDKKHPFSYHVFMTRLEFYEKAKEEHLKPFTEKLVPNIDYPAIGIRLPRLKEFAKTTDDFTFEIKYHEDVLLRGLIIANKKCDFKEKIPLINSHLQYLSSWDETDTFSSALKVKKSDRMNAYVYFKSMLKDERIYVKRLAIVWIMSNRNKIDVPLKEQLDTITNIYIDDEYYLKMALAWALSNYYITDGTLTRPYIEAIDEKTRKMAEQKIRDSRRVK